MNKTQYLKPFLKWVGGKTQLLPELRKYSPPDFNRYFEPFVGAGAWLFDLQPKWAAINDINGELINCYEVIKNNLKELLDELWFLSRNAYFVNGRESAFYKIRDLDRENDWKNVNPIAKAARTIYLNKTCYNGLYRVNSKGEFNSPYGHHKNEFKPEVDNITAVSQYLNKNDVFILNTDFQMAAVGAGYLDFVYFDHPFLLQTFS